MAKQPKSKQPIIDPYIVSVVRYKLQRFFQSISLWAIIWAVVLLLFLVVVYWQLPGELPGLTQRGLGIVFAALVAAVYFQATREPDMQDDLVARMKRGQHLDFGKQLRAVKHERRKVNLPVLGETTVRSIIGVVLVAASFGWWLTPLAPVSVAQRRIDDVDVPLTDEILAVVLVCPDGELAAAKPPTRPMSARRLAAQIPDESPPMMLVRKAISQGKYKRAKEYLLAAAPEEDVDFLERDITRAQIAMYEGDFNEASVFYKEALNRNPGDPAILAQASAAALHAGDYHQAQTLIAAAIKTCRVAGPDAAFLLAKCMQIQAALFTVVGYRYDIVEKNNKRVLELLSSEEVPEQHPSKAACYNNQAILFAISGNMPGARSMNAMAIDQWTKLDGRSPLIAAGWGNKAMLLHSEGRYIESQDAADRELIMLRNTLDIGSPAIAMGMNNAAVADLALGEYEKAEPDDVKALVTNFEKRLGKQSPPVAAAMNTVAAAYMAVALPAMARLYYEQALEVTEASLGSKHPYMITGLMGMCRVSLRQAHYDQAAEFCGKARQLAEEIFGTDHAKIAQCLLLEGQILSAQGKKRAAKPLFEQALAISKKRLGDVHPLVAQSLAGLASLENSPRTLKNAIAQYEEAVDIYKQLLGPNYDRYPAVARLLYDIAKLKIKRGDLDEAQTLLAQCRQIQEDTLVPYDPQIAETLAEEVKLLQTQKSPDEEKIEALQKRIKQIRRDYDEENRR